MMKTRNTIVAALAGVMAATTVALAPAADAVPGIGCETIRWGFLGSQRRTICDAPKQGDGSWLRAREVWVQGGWVPGWCGRYSCTAGYYREGGTVAFESYLVTDATVLPDEPAWLPPGTVVIR